MYKEECTGLVEAPGFHDPGRSLSVDFFYACIRYAPWVAECICEFFIP